MASDMPYEAFKAMRSDLIPVVSSLHCECMYTTTRFVSQMSPGEIPEWMLQQINADCRKKTKALLTPKPAKKNACK